MTTTQPTNLLHAYKQMDMDRRRDLRQAIIKNMGVCENSFYRFLYGAGKAYHRRTFRQLIEQFMNKPNEVLISAETIKIWLRDFLFLIYQKHDFDYDTHFITDLKMDQFDFVFMLKKAELDLKCSGKLMPNIEKINTVSDFINHVLNRP